MFKAVCHLAMRRLIDFPNSPLQRHNFEKPNDLRALSLMNAAARAVLNEFQTVFIAYGQSDEYSFVFRQDATICNR